MTTEMQAGVVEAPEAAEGSGLLDQIVMQSKVAVTDTEKLSARNQIAELVEEVLAGTVTISMDLAASIDTYCPARRASVGPAQCHHAPSGFPETGGLLAWFEVPRHAVRDQPFA